LKPGRFEYHAPDTLDEVVALLGERGDEAKVLAGGQSLIPLLALRLAAPSVVVDINRVEELDYLTDNDNQLKIGALTRHRAIERLDGLLDRCAMVGDAIQLVGHVAIRNRGTVLGSIAHADPAAEWPALALALDAEFDVRGPQGVRTIPADSFFVSFLTTTLQPDEVVTEMRCRTPEGTTGSSFLELSRRHGDFAVAGVGAVIGSSARGEISDARIVLIGVGETAVRAREAEQALVGAEPGTGAFEEAADIVARSIEPSGDVHGSSEYRRAVSRVLTRRALASAANRTNGGGAVG
jgi:aerobic carbon-monoxide dehydrogenase medium subunit